MGARFPVLNVRVTQHSDASNVLPMHVARVPVYVRQEAVNFSRPRVFGITMGMMTWWHRRAPFRNGWRHGIGTVRRETTEMWGVSQRGIDDADGTQCTYMACSSAY